MLDRRDNFVEGIIAVVLMCGLSCDLCYDLFNENINYLKTVLLVCIFISIYGILFSKFNLFKGVYSLVNYFNNYN